MTEISTFGVRIPVSLLAGARNRLEAAHDDGEAAWRRASRAVCGEFAALCLSQGVALSTYHFEQILPECSLLDALAVTRKAQRDWRRTHPIERNSE